MTADLAVRPIGRGWLDATVDRRENLRALALMRLLMGAVVIRHLWPDVQAAVTPVERFHVPWWSWLPVPSADLYRTIAWIGVAAGVAMIVGLAARMATATAFAVVSYLVFLDMTSFAHNRGFLVWLLFGLALLPMGGRGEPQGPWWPVHLLRIIVTSVYLTSGSTKLLNPDWRSGRILWDRMNRSADLVPFDGALHDLFLSRVFHYFLSPTAIAVELFLGVGLWFARTRVVAIWVALAFHFSIEVTASVQTFSYSAIAATLLWVTPAERDRQLSISGGLRSVVRRLDWLGRFELVDPPPRGSAGTVLIDRYGTVRNGRDATLTALSRLPLLFPLVAPLLAVTRLRGRRSPT